MNKIPGKDICAAIGRVLLMKRLCRWHPDWDEYVLVAGDYRVAVCL